MTVYRYSLKKFLKAPSTWVLLFLACSMMFLICGFLVFWVAGLHWNLKNSDQMRSLSETTAFIITHSTFGSFIALLIAVFAGFKGAQVFRDEIEDGSFLIVLSKPLSRRRIVIQKWLAFMTIFMIFIICLCLAHTLGALAAQKGNQVTRELWLAFPAEIVIALVLLLIFSSIALISSTFLSSKGVIGITFVLGMAIVFTESLPTLTYRPPYQMVDLSRQRSQGSYLPGTVNNSLYIRSQELSNKDIKVQLKEVNFSKLALQENDLYISNPGAISRYNHIWPFDLSYQVDSINSVVNKWVLIPNNPALKNNFGQVNDELQMNQVFDGYQDPQKLTLESFMSNNDYQIMKILMNIFAINSNDFATQQIWHQFSQVINETNSWINNCLQTLTTTTTKINDQNSFTIDISHEGGIKNSAFPFNNDNNQIRRQWNLLLHGVNGNDSFSLENLFRNFNDSRFIALNNDLNQQDLVDNNIFDLIMSYFQTHTITTTIAQEVVKYAQVNQVSDQPIDLSCYKYIQNGYRVLSQVARVLKIAPPLYKSQVSKINWSKLNQRIVKVKYINFANPYKIMAVYVIIAIILLPVTYFIIERQDFN